MEEKEDNEILDEIKVELSPEEKKVLEYFIKNISVGEILAIREIKGFLGVDKPEIVIRSLLQKGILERGEGCYNLAEKLRNKLFSRQ